MNGRILASTAFSAALGLAMAMQSVPVRAQGDMPQVVKDNMQKAMQEKLQKCYGVNAASKNDCAEGAHSCAGQATQAQAGGARPGIHFLLSVEMIVSC